MAFSSSKARFEKIPNWLIFVVIFVIAISYALYTNHIWEDFYITYRVSKNFATGHGLVYTIGEKVHAFTSPLNVLVPAALIIITGNTSDELVLWLFRIICCSLLGIAAVLLFKIARKNFSASLPAVVLIGLFGMDAKIIGFSINGQEIAFMMLFLALTLNALTVPSRWTVIKLGLAWAGLMWTRPDGFIYIAALSAGFLLFKTKKTIAESRFDLFKIFLSAGAIAGILYLPWFSWAWHYYGSPIPHTVIAKGQYSSIFNSSFGNILSDFLNFPIGLLVEQTSVNGTFMPTQFSFGGWHYITFVYSTYLSYMCAFYWCLPFARSQGRAVSFAFMLVNFYISCITPCIASWYIPSSTILAIFIAATMIQQSLDFAYLLKNENEKIFHNTMRFIRLVTIFALAITLSVTLCSSYQLRIQQREIEDGNRKQIGLWLRKNAASPADTVFLEPLGYIGFFSQLKMFDYPGLSAPEVVTARRKLHLTTGHWARVIAELHPDWLILRPKEEDAIRRDDPNLLTQHYCLAKTFDVSDRIELYHWLPGREYLKVDQTFYVYKLNRNQFIQDKTNN